MAEHNADKHEPRRIESLPFEEALSELERIVRRLEQGEAKLEDAIAAYQRGEALRKHCEKLLAKAQGEVEKITRNAQDEKTFSRQKMPSV